MTVFGTAAAELSQWPASGNKVQQLQLAGATRIIHYSDALHNMPDAASILVLH